MDSSRRCRTSNVRLPRLIRLLRRYLASNLAVFSFMRPLFGVTLGVLILAEPLTMNFVLGAVLVLAGIGLVSGEAWLRRLLRRGPSAGPRQERGEPR
jgi:hypothetical protein